MSWFVKWSKKTSVPTFLQTQKTGNTNLQ